jgi:hypothetical protein
VSLGSDYIFNGRPDKGLKAFEKAGGLYSKMELNTRKLLSQKVGKKIDRRVTARMISSAFDSLRPGLPDYYRAQGQGQGSKVNPINPRLSNNYIKNSTRNLMSNSDQRSALQASLRNKLALAKQLGNKSLLGFQTSPTGSSMGQRSKGYDYSKESITKDASKDLFMLIKKRYLIIQSQGRLSL